MPNRKTLVVLTVACMVGGFSSAAVAQQQGPGTQQPGGQQQGPAGQGAPGQQPAPPAQTAPAPKDVSDADLEKFAAAYGELRRIQEEHAGDLGQAGNEEKARKIQQEMQTKMADAIEAQGLSLQEYKEIFDAVRQDQELTQKVTEMVEE
ncbi:DUF4168 domain-containing protein [Thiohalorhabdus denitrificans]|nr:DUF4168 domain-containing protein [Thiohalorhabdus denitrificans]